MLSRVLKRSRSTAVKSMPSKRSFGSCRQIRRRAGTTKSRDQGEVAVEYVVAGSACDYIDCANADHLDQSKRFVRFLKLFVIERPYNGLRTANLLSSV